MDSTEKALELIRAEWLEQGCPSPASIGKRANNMPSITVRRYLDGSTKHGDPAKVRALAIALGRQDIAETVKDTVTAELSESIMKFMAEKFLLWRESNLEEIGKERELREAAEARHASEIERLTKTTGLLIARVEQLEKDKAALVEDKAIVMAEMQYCRRSKRKYEASFIVLLLLMLAYIVIVDLPNPDNGITYLLSTIFGQ